MQLVTVRNIGEVPVSFDLYHELYCEKARNCGCDIKELLRNVPQKDGTYKNRYDKVVSPRAIYLAPGQTVRLHPAVMRIQTAKNAEARGHIEVKTVEDAPKTAAPKPVTAAKKQRKSQSKKTTEGVNSED